MLRPVRRLVPARAELSARGLRNAVAVRPLATGHHSAASRATGQSAVLLVVRLNDAENALEGCEALGADVQ